jgi:hypothetical protein
MLNIEIRRVLLKMALTWTRLFFLQADTYSLGLVFFFIMKPGRSIEELSDFKNGNTPTTFGTNDMKKMLEGMTTSDISARINLKEVILTSKQIRTDLLNFHRQPSLAV